MQLNKAAGFVLPHENIFLASHGMGSLETNFVK